jgi:hypothetical protein
MLGSGAPKIKRDYIEHSLRGGGADIQAGPASYTVDEFTRKENVEKGIKKFDGFRSLLPGRCTLRDDTAEKSNHLIFPDIVLDI